MGRFANINVKDYGAVGNGTTDDTAAIQAAIDAVQTSSIGGGTVHIPKGRFLITSALSITGSNVRLVGDAAYYAGDDNDVIDSCSCITTASASINMIEIAPTSINTGKVSIENLRIYRPRALTPTGSGIHCDCSSFFFNGLNLRNVTLRCHLHGLEFEGAQGAGIISIRDSWIVINEEWGIYASGYITNLSITGSVIRQNGDGDGAGSTTMTDSSYHGGICLDGTADGVFLAGNDFEGQPIGIRLDSVDGASILGNYFEDCSNCGIYCGNESGGIVIEGNTMTAADSQDCAIFLSRCYGGARVRHNANQQVYVRQSIDIDCPPETMTPLDGFDVTGATYTWIATRASNITSPPVHDKHTLSFAGESPSGAATHADTTDISGPFGIPRHVKKLTVTNVNEYILADIENVPTPAVGDWMCASTFLYWPSGNTNGPSFRVMENINGAGASETASYVALVSLPTDEWILWRFVRKVAAAQTHDMYVECRVPTAGEYEYLYGTHCGQYGEYPEMPTCCIITSSERLYPLSLEPNNMTYLGTASPTDAEWTGEVGEKVYDNAPAAGGHIGEVCTGAGAPGTWKTFGDITA